MKKTTTITLLLAALIASGPANPLTAQEGIGGAPGAFLFMGVGARALGMGGAYSAVANDVTAIYWNPAGLATLDPIQISINHASLFLDTSLDFFAAMAPTARYGTFAAALLSVGSQGFEQRTVLNEVVGSFNTGEMAFLASWSREWFGGFSVGINYKFVKQKILTYSDGGHGLDLGIKTTLSSRLSGGLVFRNLINPKVNLYNDSQSSPMQVSAGVASGFFNDHLTLSVEFSKINGWGEGRLHFGSEYNFKDRLALRVGLGAQSVTVGAGFAFDAFGLEYSNGGTDLGTSHRFSLSYSFGGLGVSASATPRVFSPAGEFNVTKVKLKVRSRNAIKKWSFVIKDSDNRDIWAYEANGKPPEEIVWDGRNSMGSLVPDGRFKYWFSVWTVHGKEMTRSGDLVTIDSRGPVGEIVSNEGE